MSRVQAVILAIGAAVLFGIATAFVVTADPFDQRNFPCQEDEVLGYAPQFGPDRVGCIHVEQR